MLNLTSDPVPISSKFPPPGIWREITRWDPTILSSPPRAINKTLYYQRQQERHVKEEKEPPRVCFNSLPFGLILTHTITHSNTRRRPRRTPLCFVLIWFMAGTVFHVTTYRSLNLKLWSSLNIIGVVIGVVDTEAFRTEVLASYSILLLGNVIRPVL